MRPPKIDFRFLFYTQKHIIEEKKHHFLCCFFDQYRWYLLLYLWTTSPVRLATPFQHCCRQPCETELERTGENEGKVGQRPTWFPLQRSILSVVHSIGRLSSTSYFEYCVSVKLQSLSIRLHLAKFLWSAAAYTKSDSFYSVLVLPTRLATLKVRLYCRIYAYKK